MKSVVIAAVVAGFAVVVHLPSAFACGSGSPSRTAHYEWQYHYDRHAQWVGHWVLVQ